MHLDGLKFLIKKFQIFFLLLTRPKQYLSFQLHGLPKQGRQAILLAIFFLEGGGGLVQLHGPIKGR